MDLKISIAMATYNGAKYLPEQLESFVAQTDRPAELVVCDDHSIDGTLGILEEFAETAPFEVRIIRNEMNRGYAQTFNRALEATTGDLVFLSDQDDVWFPEKIRRVEQEARTSTALVIMNDAALTDADLNDSGLTKLGQMRSGGLPDSRFVMGCCAAIKRDLLDLCLPIPEGYPSHDGWIVKFADGLGRKLILDILLQYYRRHELNESQFIANRTAKITRSGALLHRMHGILKDDAAPAGSQLQRLNLFLQGVHSAQQRDSGRYTSELRVLEASLTLYRSNLVERMRIRSKPRIRRVLTVISLWAAGGYKEFSGAYSAVRDIVFR